MVTTETDTLAVRPGRTHYANTGTQRGASRDSPVAAGLSRRLPAWFEYTVIAATALLAVVATLEPAQTGSGTVRGLYLLCALLPALDAALTIWAWRISGALWVYAFAVFLWRYIPVLSAPRADGKPG